MRFRNTTRGTELDSTEAARLLAGRPVGAWASLQLTKLVPAGQLLLARMMVATGNYSGLYAETLETASPSHAKPFFGRRGPYRAIKAKERRAMERQAAPVRRAFLAARERYGQDQLDLILVAAFVRQLLQVDALARYLSGIHARDLSVLQRVIDDECSARPRINAGTSYSPRTRHLRPS